MFAVCLKHSLGDLIVSFCKQTYTVLLE